MTFALLAIVTPQAIAGVNPNASGQQDKLTAVSKWIAESWQSAGSRVFIANLAYEWKVSTVRVQDAANSVRDESQYILRAATVERWRLNETFLDPHRDVDYVDRVRNEESAWKLTPNWLILLNTDEQPTGHPILRVGASAFDQVRSFTNYGFPYFVARSLRPAGLTMPNSTTWRVYAVSDAGAIEFQIDGSWNRATGTPQVDAITSRRSNAVIHRFEYSSWTFDPATGVAVADEVRVLDDHRLIQVLQPIRVWQPESQPFEQILRTPSNGDTDPFRGSIELRSITDYTTVPPRQKVVGADGRMHEATLDELGGLVSDAYDTFRLSGQSLCAASILILLGIWSRKIHQKHLARESS